MAKPPDFTRYAEEAEHSVLGAMLIDNDCIATVTGIVDASMFSPAYGKHFAAMLGLYEKRGIVDPPLLLDNGWDAMLVCRLLDVVTAANVEYHARLVRDRWQVRQLAKAGTQIVELCQQDHSPAELVDEAERLIFGCTAQDTNSPVRLKSLLFPAIERLEELRSKGDGITGVPTGFHDLDEMTGGLQPGNLIVIAGRPSMGKSAITTALTLNPALKGTGAAMFSLEMTRMEVTQRMIAHESFVDLFAIMRGRPKDADLPRIAQAATLINNVPVWIDDSSAMSVTQVRGKARRLKAENPELGLIVVDYLQLMSGDGDNREQVVSGISRGLKSLAKELNVPIVALSQLSRGPENRQDHRPNLSDLRESGAIEQDADVVMFLYRPEYYDPMNAELRGKAELIISKQRNGPTGVVELYFRKECARFESIKTWRPAA